jgi:predicted acyltransferase
MATGIARSPVLNHGQQVRTARLASVDAYRGIVMLLMLAEVLRSCAVASALPNSWVWRLACSQQTHSPWLGCTLHDLIQPGFFLLVGVGAHLSLARRVGHQSTLQLSRHVALRSLALIFLGMALVASHPRQWSWRFFDTLTQIGLAYPVLFVVALGNTRQRLIAFAGILAIWWVAFVAYPLPPPDFDYQSVGVSADWLSAYGLHGFAEHWQKNANMAAAFDRWFLNLFPGDRFTHSFDGAVTLNFVPSVATMILGLMAGEILQRKDGRTVTTLIVSGAGMTIVGWTMGYVGICPIIKLLWTPAWVLFSGGLSFIVLAAFYFVVDMHAWRRIAFPLIVPGANSLVAYCLSHLTPAFAFHGLLRVLGPRPFQLFGVAYQPFVYGAALLSCYFLLLFVLYQRRIFVRV